MDIRDSGWRGASQEVAAHCLQFHQWTAAHWGTESPVREAHLLGVSPLMAALPGSASLPQVVVHTPVIGNDDRLGECWEAAQPVVSGSYGGWRFRRTDDLLFGAICLDEASFAPPVAAGPGEPDTALRRATEAAYRELFGLLECEGFPHLLRVWNYLPGINAVQNGLERYRQFNIGRQDAFLAYARPHTQGSPAACALGTVGGGLTVYFLAGRKPVVAIENPRQVSAYHYPTRYGPRAPTFSRAALAHLPGMEALFVSGTASIVGHQTLHAGDVVAQTLEAMTNVQAVVDQANLVAVGRFELADLVFKVYLRHPADFTTVRAALSRIVEPRVPPVFVQADICRDDLLVEIEATALRAG